MTFQHMVDTDMVSLLTLILPITIIVVLGLISYKYEESKFILFILITGVILATASMFPPMFIADNIRVDNAQRLASNIEQKYDINEIKIDETGRDEYGKSVSGLKTEEQQVYVVIDGITYAYYLTQDESTWEPTLSKLPSENNNSQEVNVPNPKELLK